MKRTSLALGLSVLLMAPWSVAYANVVHASGSTGKPSSAYSNTGSTQGVIHRSPTGTTNKVTHDGAVTMDS